MPTKDANGRVYLVGAGPGDPGLMSRRALDLIARADVILHDRLIPAQALAGARADAEILYVGKDGSRQRGDSVPQEQTEALMVERACAGKRVVRLKGGDPFVFGRGGEEALRLRAAGVPFEVVPGITAGIAASAYAGIPVTHRTLASALALITGHEDPAKGYGALDWDALARFPGTLVFYMGVKALASIANELMRAGRSPSEPAAVIESGTLPTQRTIRAELRDIARSAQEANVCPPSVTVIGEVSALADELAWFEDHERPLAGRSVTVTRARAQASELSERLQGLGASVVAAPSIRIEPLAGPVPDLRPYDLLCLTSPNGVDVLFEKLFASGRDARALAHCRIAAIGPGTARALHRHGINPDVLPARFLAEGLIEALADQTLPALRQPIENVLIARAGSARETLPEALRASGAHVDVLDLYETVPEPMSAHALSAASAADYITFTSSSTVRFFVGFLANARADGAKVARSASGRGAATAQARQLLAKHTRVVSIGPVTSAALREHGIEPHVQAERHDIDGLLDALLADAADHAAG